ncbi:MAG TPA: Na(+)/H(+) antiporter subunit D [Nitrospinae bacterium]|nr:Na(+)/H(+) antiporter subunit D [Nitrospinota bacterium]
MMSSLWINPAFLFILGSFLIPILKGRAKQTFLLLVPATAFLVVNSMSQGTYGAVQFLGMELIFGKVDRLSLVFAHVFTLMAFIGVLYGLHVKDDGQHIASFLYVGSSLGVTFAGDYVTIFIFWEIMAFSSVFLVWYRKTQKAVDAGFRYLLVHIVGGLFLLAGILLRYGEVGNFTFGPISPEGATLAIYLIMIGFCLNAAVPPIHAWLPDAYPEATVTGAVFMCAFTTKTAVYVLARAFAGFEILAILGAIMAVYGVCYAVIENDARRILAYHIVSQVGYMVCGIGIGSQMAVNGATAHAYAHIIYKGLLFMGAGAVLEMTGRSKLNELGGLYKYMPLALFFTVTGGISISGFPFTSGFISKSMTAEAAEGYKIFIFLMLMTASIGTFLSVGLKLPYFIWFNKDSGLKPKEAPLNMNLAMGIAAFICYFLGVYPKFLFDMLPYPVHWEPYTISHFAEVMQLLLFTGLGFLLLLKKLTPEPTLNLDVDWFYRKGSKVFMWVANKPIAIYEEYLGEVYNKWFTNFTLRFSNFLWRIFDVKIIDGIVNDIAGFWKDLGGVARLTQTGLVRNYAFFMLLGGIVFITYYLFK